MSSQTQKISDPRLGLATMFESGMTNKPKTHRSGIAVIPKTSESAKELSEGLKINPFN
jgi:hypothetical protein